MTILFVLENYYPNIGGVETLFLSLAQQLSDKGHQVIILTTQLEKEHPRKEKIDNITILRYPFKNRYFFTFFAVFPILRLAPKVDLIHTTSYNAGLPAFFAAKLRRKKVIITFHEMWGKLWFRLPYMSGIGKRLHYWFEQFLVKLPFDKFVAVSESTAENLRQAGVSNQRIVTNYNGIDYNDFLASDIKIPPTQAFTYTYFGRLGVSKGIDLLLQAASRLQSKLPNAKLQLIIPKTPAPFFQEIIKRIEELNLHPHIQLLHHLPFDTLKTSIQRSHCVVIPSYSEGFCFAAVEAIALGVPVISSNQQALREVISGKFIKMQTLSVDALEAALLQAAQGNWDESPIQRFHLNETVQNYIHLYESILKH